MGFSKVFRTTLAVLISLVIIAAAPILLVGSGIFITSCNRASQKAKSAAITNAAPLTEIKTNSQPEASPIIGAFGVKLGDVFSVSNAIYITKTTAGNLMYQFRPSNPYRSFEEYYVLLTPRERRIYCIWGIGKVADISESKQEKDVLVSQLEDKYGKQKDTSDDDAALIDQGKRAIKVKLESMSKKIEIQYCDYQLMEIAKSERLELGREKADGKGL
jgi:hypothetical protein